MDFPALQVKPIEIQPNTGFVNSLLAASQIRNANTQNDLAQFGLQQKQDENNALANYSRRNAENDPNSLDALSGHPEAMARMAQVRGTLDAQRRERFDYEMTNKGRAAAAVLSLPPDQQETAFRQQLDMGLKNGWLSKDGYAAALSKPFNPLALRQIALNGMTADKILANEQSDQDRAAGREFMGRFGRTFSGQQAGAEPPPGEVVSTGGGSIIGGLYGKDARIIYPDLPPSGGAPAPVMASPGVSAPLPPATVTPLPPATVTPSQVTAPTAPVRSAAPQPAPQISPSPSLGGVNLDKMMPLLLEGALRPGLSKDVQETSRALLVKAFDQYPQQVRELELFKERPDLFDMALKLKQAGATSINTAEGLDAAQTKGRIAIDQAAIKDMAEKNAKSASAIPLLQHVLQISKNTPSGYAGAIAPVVAKAAATLGIPVTEGMSNAELFQSITRQLVPSVRDPGSASNLEQQMYQAALPNASQSVEGREKIAEMFIRMQKRDQEVVKLYRDNLGSPDLSKKLEELSNKPLFTPEDKQWLELNVRAGDLTRKPATQMNKTSTGVQWSIGP